MWENHKGNVLQKDDKSFKGSIDFPVRELVNVINESKDFLTLSSCSGRIMLINELSKDKRKNKSEFLFVSHDYLHDVEIPKLMDSLTIASGHVFLKLEPIIMHVQCRTLEDATWLLHLMKSRDQFKHSCIVSAINEKWIVAIKGVVKMEVPLVYNGVMLAEIELLTKYVHIANERMVENFKAIEALTSFMKEGPISRHAVQPAIVDFTNMRPIAIMAEDNANTLLSPWSCISIESRNFSLDKLARFVTDLHDQKRIGIRPSSDGLRPFLCDGSFLCKLADGTFLVTDQSGEMWALRWFMNKPKILEFIWRIVETSAHDMLRVSGLQWVAEEVEPCQPFKGTYEKYGKILVVQDRSNTLPPISWERLCRSKDCTAVVQRHQKGEPFGVLVNLGDDLVADFKDNGTRYRIDMSRHTFSSNIARERIALDISGGTNESILEYCDSPNCFGIHLLRKCKNITKYYFVIPDGEDVLESEIRQCLELNGISEERFQILPSLRCKEFHACKMTRMILGANNSQISMEIDELLNSWYLGIKTMHIEGLEDSARVPQGFTIVGKSHSNIVDLVRATGS